MGAYAHRMRRSSTEIAIAAALTLAAIVFLAVTLVGGGTSSNNSKLGPIASENTVIKQPINWVDNLPGASTDWGCAHKASHRIAQKYGIGRPQVLKGQDGLHGATLRD